MIASFSYLPGSSAPGLRVLCADSLKSVIDNYAALEGTWVEAADATKDTETKAHIHGVSALMKTFKYRFGNMLGEMILRHTDNLSAHCKTNISQHQRINRLLK